MATGPGEITVLLHRALDGHDSEAQQQLFLRVEQELRAIAAARLRRLPSNRILQPTELIDDAFMRLVNYRHIEWEGRGQFFRVANGVMRRILCDQVRRGLQRRRLMPLGSDELPDGRYAAPEARLQGQEMLQGLLEALGRLELEDADAAAVFEVRFFGGRCLLLGAPSGAFDAPEPGRELLPFSEVATILGIPRSTAFAHWLRAVERLQAELQAFAPSHFQDVAHVP